MNGCKLSRNLRTGGGSVAEPQCQGMLPQNSDVRNMDYFDGRGKAS